MTSQTNSSVNLSGSLAEQGESQVFTFTGATGDRIVIDSLKSYSAAENFTYSLRNPSGFQIVNNPDYNDSSVYTLTQAGTYQLTLSGSTTGSYNLNLLTLNRAPSLTLGTTLTSTLTPGLEKDVYLFTGSKGQRLQFDNLSASAYADWSLTGPNSQTLVSNSLSTDFNVTLPTDGEYYLIINGSSTASVSYSFQVNDISDAAPVAPTTFPFARSGNVSGTPVDYSFSAAAGQFLYFDSLDPDFDSVSVTITAPDGTTVYSANAGYDSGDYFYDKFLILPRSGSYTVRLSGTGDYNFRILDAQANASDLSLGTAVSTTIDQASTKLYRFTGSVGQRLVYDALDLDYDSVNTYLVGPSGTRINAIGGGNASSDSDLFTLSEAGTYVLVQSGGNFAGLDIGFQLVQPSATALAFDTNTSITLAPYAKELRRFNGTAGQRLVFDSPNSSFNGYWALRGPNNESINSTPLSYDFPATLPASGEYVLVLENSGSTSLPFNFQVVTPTTTTTALTLGSPTSGTIGELGEQDIYTLTGTAGQRLYFDALNNYSSSKISWSLRSPSGAFLFNGTGAGYDSSFPFTLTESGQYQLIVEGQFSSTDSLGDYNFQVIDVGSAPTISLDATVAGTLNPSRESDFYRFTASSAGQRLSFDAISGSNANWYIYNQSSFPIKSGSIKLDSDFTSPRAGEYILQIFGFDGNSTPPISYSFQLVTPTSPSSALTLSAPVSGNIGELGEQDLYTFAGTAGQRLFFDALANDGNNLYWTLTAPSGRVVVSQASINYDANTLPVLTETGTYRLLVEGIPAYGNSTGAYNFQLLDATAAPLITLANTVSGALNPGNESDFYRFTGTAGQRVSFDAISASTGQAYWVLWNQDQNYQTYNSVTTDQTFTLGQTGEYYLQIQGYASSSLSYSFQLVAPTTTTTALTLGNPVSSTIAVVGEQDLYTFNGVAGQRVLFDSLANNGNNLYWTLTAPSGASINSGDTDSDSEPFTLAESGAYKLQVDGVYQSANTGAYNFQLLDASAAPSISQGTTISGTLAPGTENALYRLAGTAGQQLLIDSLDPAPGTTWWLYNDRNQYINYNFNGNDFAASLPTTATYLLRIAGSNPGDTPYRFTVTDTSPAPPPPFTLTSFPFARSGTQPPSPTDVTLTLAAGTPFLFDSLDQDNFDIFVSIFDGTGTIYNQSDYYDSDLIIAPRSGDYTLRLSGSGDYNYRLLNPQTNATAFALNTDVSTAIGAAAETRIFSFTATAGQRLHYDALEEDGDPIRFDLIRPDGTKVISSQSAETDTFGFVTLDASGTYYLLMRNTSATAAGDISFRLNALDAAAVAPFDTTFTGTLTPGTKEAVYQFEGTAGQRLLFDSQTTGSPNAYYYLFSPANNTSVSNAYITSDLEVTLPATGTYGLILDGYAQGPAFNYSFNIVTPSSSTTALTLNTATSGSLDEKGERDIYTFTGSIGQRIFFDSLSSLDAYVSLIDPTGAQVFAGYGSQDQGLKTLEKNGTYQLVLESTSASSWPTGSYNFRLLDLAGAPALSFNTLTTDTLSPAKGSKLYRFAGTAGQRLFFDSQTTTSASNTYYYLYGPGGDRNIASNYILYDSDITLPSNGTYALLIDGEEPADFNYSFSLLTPTTTTTALTLNAATSGIIPGQGDQRIYTFSGTAGQRLYYDALKTDTSDFFLARLFSPSGTLIINQEADSDRALFTLNETGTYQLILGGLDYYGWDTGSFNFRLLDLASAPAAAFDTPITGNLAAGGAEINLYRFTGTAGQRLFFDSQTASTNGAWTIYGPTDAYLTSLNISSDFEFILPSDGTYAVYFENYSSTTALSYTTQIVTPTTALTGAPSLTVNNVTGFANQAIPLPISASFTASDGNDIRTIQISGVPSTATLSSGTNSGGGVWTLTPAQLNGLTITTTAVSNFALTVIATGAEPTGDTASTALVFNVTVNTAVGVTVSPQSGLQTSEAGQAATFTVVLDSQPTGDVTIGISSSDTTEGTTNVSSLTFTSSNWNVPQTVIVTGVDDPAIDGTIAYTINTAPATSSDPLYSGINPADVSVSNLDNDTAGFDITPVNNLFTSEAGGQATFFVRLISQPSANVTIAISSNDTTEGVVSVSSLTFTPANWNTYQQVLITGVNDSIFDGNIAYNIITGAASSTDTNYAGINPVDVSVTNIDNDIPGVSLSTTGYIFTSEAGTSATFTVVLDTQPTANVSIGLTSSDLTEGTVLPTSLTFTSINWNTPQTVTVTGVDDAADDNDIVYFILTGNTTSTDPNYNNLTVADVAVINTDNDTAGITVSPTSGLVTTEAGGTASFTVVLNSQPSSNVTIGLSSSNTAEGTLSASSLTFTTANWNIPQTVTVTGVDDVSIDGNVGYSIITAAASSADGIYNGFDAANIGVTNVDNDIAGIRVVPTTGLITTEAGGTSSFTVVLDSQPTASVFIGLSSSNTAEGTLSTSSLTFTTTNWNTPQTVTVTGVNDFVDDGDIAYSIVTAAATSGDANYNGLNAADVSLTNTDNDTAGITVSPTSGLTTTEAGGTASFSVVLNSQPTAPVTIGLSSNDTTEGTLSTSSLTFTAANWNVAQIVTVTGVDDILVDGNVAYSIISAPATSSDTTYNGLNAADVSLTNTDNDTAGITVSPTSGLTTTEAGGTASFSVVLNTQPTAPVTIALSSNDTTEGTVSVSSLTFTAANWNVAQTVTVTGVDDSLVDGNVAYSILTAAATSTDTNYNGLNAADVSLTNTDNDSAGITVSPTSGLITTEAGGTASFSVVLNSQPTAPVTIGLSSNDTTEGTLSTSSLTFTAANWNIAQTVTVTGVDDSLVDGNIAYSILTAAATSTDTNYNGLNAADVSLTNTDNDTAGITVSPTSGLITTEAGGTASFSVVLNSQPTAPVTIALSSNDTTEGTVSVSSLTFTAANWNVAQTVTVTGVDDILVDGNIAYSIVTAAATSTDGNYNGLNAADVSLTNTDNDTAGITVSPTSGLITTEAGGTASFSVVLNSQPTATVTIGLSSNDTTEGTLSTSSLTFTAANWNVAQTVTVTGVDDIFVDGNVAYSIISAAATSTDTNYNGLNAADVSLINTDNDTAGITVSPTSGLITTEAGGTASFSVVLNSQPTAPVTIALSSNDTTEGTLSVSSLTFTAANWNIAQTVTVTGVDDILVDGNVAYSIISAPATSSDANYNGLNAADVSLTNTDNDSPGITVSPTSGLTTTEAGGTASFSVVLNSQPTAPVTIALSSNDTTEGLILKPAELVFNVSIDDPLNTYSAYYSALRSHTLAAGAAWDAYINGSAELEVHIGFSSSIPRATGRSLTTSFIRNNGTYNVYDQGAAAEIRTGIDPNGETPDVELIFNPDYLANELWFDPNPLQRTSPVPGERTDAMSVFIHELGHAFAFNGWLDPFTGTHPGDYESTFDEKTAFDGNNFFFGGDQAKTLYGGPVPLTYGNYMHLGNNPPRPGNDLIPDLMNGVVYNRGIRYEISALDVAIFSDVGIPTDSTSPTSLIFTPENWNIPQIITIAGVDDFLDDGDIAYSIVTAAATSSDTTYNGLNAADVSLTNTDNDTAGITVSPTSGLTTTEAGGTASFSVVLNSQPTAPVTIGLSSNDTTEGTLSTSSLTFTAANWNVAQTVTVTGVDDLVDDGDIAYSIVTAAATSSDTNYNGLNAADVSLTNTDNDTAGITVSPTSGLTTTEAGGTASFSVVLNSQPTATVTIGLSSNDTTEGTLSTSSLTFTAANWNVAQTVTVTGVDDILVDGNVAYSILTAAATSGDANYNGLNAADVSLTNTDNDSAGITVSPTSGLITTEAGGTASFSVVLNTQPTAPVTIALSSNDTTEGAVSVSSLTFTAANWNIAQTVTVTGVDDSLVDGNIAYSIVTAAATSTDGNYNGLNAADVSLTNTDNDTAGITVSPTSGLITTEAGGTASFSVVLNTQPTAPVTIALSSNDTTEGAVSVSSLTFTAANWNIAQTVTVTGVDDSLVDGNIAYSILTAAATSTDTNYNGLNAADVSLTNTDNDTAGITVSPTSGLITTEAGGTASFSVVLNTQPTAPVTIALSSNDTTEGTVSVSSLTFTAANWNIAQTVTVTGVDDLVDDGDIAYSIVTAAATSTDTNYNGLNAADVSLINTDNDTAGITVSPTSGLITTEAGGTASFSVVLNSQPTAPVTIALSSNDTTEGTVSVSSLTFTAANWNIAQTVTVTGVDDLVDDGDIAYSIVTAAATSTDTNYNGLNAADVSLTNTDNDTAGITVSPTSGLITTEAGGTASFSVVLNSQPTATVTIALSSNDTTEGTVSVSSLTFTAANWNVAQTVTVTGVDDILVDGNIAYSIVTAAATSTDTNYNGLDATDVTVTNIDDDSAALPVITIDVNPTTVTENGVTNLIYTFTRTGVTTNTLTVNYTITGSATNGTDYVLIPASVTFNADSPTATVTVDPTGDLVLEPDETVSLTLQSNPAYTIGTIGAVTGTISNDDAASFSISDVTLTEGDSGTKTAQFIVSLNNAVDGGASVSYASADGSATASSDYVATSGTLNFTGIAGETKSVSVIINADTRLETNETFFLNLSSPTNGVTLFDSQGVGTINNDDAASFSISDVTLTEGNSGTTTAQFIVSLNNAVDGGASVSYATADGSATASSDYVATSGILNFTGIAGETKSVSVIINADTRLETNETFFLNLSSPTNGVTLFDSQGVGTINNDDAASFSISDVTLTEGNSGTTTAQFLVTLSNAVDGGASVSYASADGTATASSDYVATSGILNFTGIAGETKSVSVIINGDTTFEPNEIFLVNLSSPTNGVTLFDSQGVGTINNDDAAVTTFSIGNKVFRDDNGNGLQDPSEVGVGGVRVELFKDNTSFSTTTTGPVGDYLFSDLAPGNYELKFDLPIGYTFTSVNVGVDDALDSDADPTTGRTGIFALLSTSDLTRDAGLKAIGQSITGTNGGAGDMLTGTPGDDEIYGRGGPDILTGGPGADKFIYKKVTEGIDRILDFNKTEGDKIVILDVLKGLGYMGNNPIGEGYLRFAAQGASGSILQIAPLGFGSPRAFNFIQFSNVTPSELNDPSLYL